MKKMIMGTFDDVSGSYDSAALRFFSMSARNLAEILEMNGDEHVLDVATGTGHAALELAGRLPQGRVTGVDFSAGMLEQARRKAEERGVTNVDFQEMDMDSLAELRGSFDVAVCAFGIFFVEDMEGQLRQIAGMVKPGGKVAITTFVKDYFQPLSDLLFDRVQSYGIQLPPATWKRIGSQEGCRALFKQAGLERITVEYRNVGYYLTNAEEWWEVVWNGGFRRLVAQLSPDRLDQFRREHLEEIEALKTEEGIWMDIGVLYPVGFRP